MAALVCAVVPGELASAPFPARAWQAVALGALLAAIAVTGAVVLVGGLAALPALVRFVRAGGWPKIRRRVEWAAGATAVAGGGLAGPGLSPWCSGHSEASSFPSLCSARIRLSSFTACWSSPAD